MDTTSENVPTATEMSQHEGQTAADFIDQQLSLEQDAREVLPYVRARFVSSDFDLTRTEI